jgi:hypothetical protein
MCVPPSLAYNSKAADQGMSEKISLDDVQNSEMFSEGVFHEREVGRTALCTKPERYSCAVLSSDGD